MNNKGDLLEFIAVSLQLVIYAGIFFLSRYLGSKKVRATLILSAAFLLLSYGILVSLFYIFLALHWDFVFFVMFAYLYAILSVWVLILLIILLLFAYIAVWFSGKEKDDTEIHN